MSSRCEAYWWGVAQKRLNFGDLIAPYLLNHFAGAETVWRAPEDAQVIVTGSILHHMPDNWEGTVLGAGSLYPDSKYPVHADYKAVRGPLTASLVSGNPVLGDPGLLAGELVGYQERVWDLGIVAHWSDKELEHRTFLTTGVQVIDVAANPLEVLKQIASCKRIITSSLHGAIVADALGIPRRVEVAGLPRFAAEGGDHKFRDYSASVGIPFRTGEFQAPVFSKIEDLQHGLYDCFREYGSQLRRGAWSARSDDMR